MRGIRLYRVSDPTAHDFVDRRLRYWQGFVQRWEEVRQPAAEDYARWQQWWSWWQANASMCAHCHQWTYAGETHSCR